MALQLHPFLPRTSGEGQIIDRVPPTGFQDGGPSLGLGGAGTDAKGIPHDEGVIDATPMAGFVAESQGVGAKNRMPIDVPARILHGQAQIAEYGSGVSDAGMVTRQLRVFRIRFNEHFIGAGGRGRTSEDP